MPGTLYVVATPIGNLEDVTLRALRILREVALIAAEDTRRTARLLQHYSIPTPTTSLHEHNEYARTPGLIARLSAGESIALVSDAGTPGISDPGARLVAAAHAAGVRVEPVPGPSAVAAMLSASGLADEGFVFVGFAPSRAKARRDWLTDLGSEKRPIVLFEAPHRIRQLLQDVHDILGDRLVAIGRELTKAHESLGIRQISAWLSSPPPERGEFVVVVNSPKITPPLSAAPPSDTEVAVEFGRLTDNGSLGRREAIRQIATKRGLSTKEVFSALDRAKKSGE